MNFSDDLDLQMFIAKQIIRAVSAPKMTWSQAIVAMQCGDRVIRAAHVAPRQVEIQEGRTMLSYDGMAIGLEKGIGVDGVERSVFVEHVGGRMRPTLMDAPTLAQIGATDWVVYED